MLKSELFLRLRGEIGPGEWDDLAAGRLPVSAFNRETLLALRDAQVPVDSELDARKLDGLNASLEGYLSKHLPENPDVWRWIRLSCAYLAFVAERPMHPIEQLKIKATALPDGRMRYECPEKSLDPRSVCRWCVCRRMSNYEIMKRRMQASFLEYDQAAMIEKFGLEHDEGGLYLRFVGREYRVSRADGAVAWSPDGFKTLFEADYNEAMTIYDVLCHSKPDCRASGRYVNMSTLGGIQGGSMPSGEGGMLKATVAHLDRHRDRIAGACRRLGGEADERGELAYKLPMFDFLSVILRFWASDDEFPASLDVFVDEHMLDFMHYETVWFAVIHLLTRLKEEMDA